MSSNARRVYMDNHATTPVDPRVVEAMLPYLTERFGNPSSRTHAFGWEAEKGVEHARGQVATLIGARPKEIVFTAGATEADNLAVKGIAAFRRERGEQRPIHVVTVSTEHKAVLDTCRTLERAGLAEVTYLKPCRDGSVDLDVLREAITERTALVSIHHANGEIGTIQPLAEIGAVTRAAGVLLHTDAAQSLGKVPIDVDAMNVDLLSASSHKLYGPKGVGMLFVRSRDPRVRLTPMIDGGGQERGMRSGTLNVPGIVGFGAACEIAGREMAEETPRLAALRDRLRESLFDELDQLQLNGPLEQRLAGNLNVCFTHVEGESLLMSLKDVALSSGSACSSASLEPSHVLRAIGVSDEMAHSSIRFGIGRFNDDDDVRYVGERVVAEVRRLRRLSPSSRVRRAETATGAPRE
jgi:cysteine desulfurase